VTEALEYAEFEDETPAPGESIIMLPVPPEALKRLRVAERRQRNETKLRGLLAVPVSVEGLLLLQGFRCGCGCGDPLDFASAWDEKSPPPGYPVIAHRLARGSRGEHTPNNLGIDRHACNKRDAGPDTSGAASVKRFTPDHSKKFEPEPERRSATIRKPVVSSLSKDHPNYKAPKWNSRKFERKT
jgi:hypothetical protein